jgi:hypothetical protein
LHKFSPNVAIGLARALAGGALRLRHAEPGEPHFRPLAPLSRGSANGRSAHRQNFVSWIGVVERALERRSPLLGRDALADDGIAGTAGRAYLFTPRSSRVRPRREPGSQSLKIFCMNRGLNLWRVPAYYLKAVLAP